MLHPPAIMGETALKIAPTSLQNRDSAIAALALTAPIVMELAAEFVLSCIRRNDAKKADVLPDQELLNPTERLVLVFGILTIPIAALMPSEILNLVYVDTCLRKCRSMLVTGVIIVSLCRNDPQIWSVRITYLVLVLLVVGAVTGAFAADVKITKSIGTAFYTCGITVFFFCNARWVYSVLPELSKVLTLSNAVQGISLREESAAGITEILFMLLYIGTITTVTMILIAVNVIFPGIGFFTPNAAFYNNIAFVLYLLFMMYISKRKMKYKMLQGLVRSPSYAFTEILFTHTANFLFVLFNPKYALIESKKMYVRYISHELRTPLNSAFLGTLHCIKLTICDMHSSLHFI